MRKPAQLSFVEAASIPENFFTGTRERFPYQEHIVIQFDDVSHLNFNSIQSPLLSLRDQAR
jgi:hypothetical protein